MCFGKLDNDRSVIVSNNIFNARLSYSVIIFIMSPSLVTYGRPITQILWVLNTASCIIRIPLVIIAIGKHCVFRLPFSSPLLHVYNARALFSSHSIAIYHYCCHCMLSQLSGSHNGLYLYRYFAPERDAKYCDHRVCLSVCLFICLFFLCARISKNHTSKFHHISAHLLSVTIWLGPPLTTVQYVMYFWFCG